MWGGSDDDLAIQTIQTALDKGITLIDTAPIYGFGHSEKIVGKALEQYDRESYIISTKAGLEWRDEQPYRNATRARLENEIDDSLQRLKTDYVDIYFVHWPDPLVPIEETATTMAEFYEAGKIRAIGVSNYSAQEMEMFQQFAPIHFCQPPYNIFERHIEKRVLPYCKNNNIAVMAYGALCRGMLSGKMEKGREFHGDDLRKVDPKFQEPQFDQYLAAADRLDAIAKERFDKEVIHLAIRWILDQGVSTALWGARKPDQLDPIDGIDEWSLGAKDLDAVDAIVEEEIDEPIGPAFMAPPTRPTA